jgi:hypothetical protein
VLHAEAGSDTEFDPASGYVRLMDGLVCGIRTERCCETTALAGRFATIATVAELAGAAVSGT